MPVALCVRRPFVPKEKYLCVDFLRLGDLCDNLRRGRVGVKLIGLKFALDSCIFLWRKMSHRFIILLKHDTLTLGVLQFMVQSLQRYV
jgi:hypothetical protein